MCIIYTKRGPYTVYCGSPVLDSWLTHFLADSRQSAGEEYLPHVSVHESGGMNYGAPDATYMIPLTKVISLSEKAIL